MTNNPYGNKLGNRYPKLTVEQHREMGEDLRAARKALRKLIGKSAKASALTRRVNAAIRAICNLQVELDNDLHQNCYASQGNQKTPGVDHDLYFKNTNEGPDPRSSGGRGQPL